MLVEMLLGALLGVLLCCAIVLAICFSLFVIFLLGMGVYSIYKNLKDAFY